MNLLWVALGGAVGAMCRYGFSKWLAHLSPHPKFSTGILVANLLGCFLMGVLVVKVQALDGGLREALAAFILTGLLGSFTTYSTYVLEMVKLLEAGAWRLFSSYLGAHFVGGLLALWVGLKIGTAWTGTAD